MGRLAICALWLAMGCSGTVGGGEDDASQDSDLEDSAVADTSDDADLEDAELDAADAALDAIEADAPVDAEIDATLDGTHDADDAVVVDSALDAPVDVPADVDSGVDAAADADAGPTSCDFPTTMPATAAALHVLARCLDEVEGDNGLPWNPDVTPGTPESGYTFDPGYLATSYLNLYLVTLEVHWLERFVALATELLAQRDDGCTVTGCVVWEEPLNAYPWAGFSGAMLAPMARFARLVRATAALQTHVAADGRTLLAHAVDYVAAARAALAFHEPDWADSGDEGAYSFADDVPMTTLQGDHLPYNMLVFLGDLYRELGRYETLEGHADVAADDFNRSTRIARFFRNRLEHRAGFTGFMWKYGDYAFRVEDVGHGNADIHFAYFDYLASGELDLSDMNDFTATFERVLEADGRVPFVLIDQTNIPGLTSHSVFFWMYLTEFSVEMWTRAQLNMAIGRKLFNVATLGYVRFVRGAR